MKMIKLLSLAIALAFFSISCKSAPLTPPFIGQYEVALRSALLSLSNTVNGFTADTNGINATTATNITKSILVLSNFVQSLNGVQPTNNNLTLLSETIPRFQTLVLSNDSEGFFGYIDPVAGARIATTFSAATAYIDGAATAGTLFITNNSTFYTLPKFGTTNLATETITNTIRSQVTNGLPVIAAGAFVGSGAGLTGITGTGSTNASDSGFTFVVNGDIQASNKITASNAYFGTITSTMMNVDTLTTTNLLATNSTFYGKTGIGTNTPNATLHVAADNSRDYVMQVGTTNRPYMLTVDTNGNFMVNFTNIETRITDVMAPYVNRTIGTSNVHSGAVTNFLVSFPTVGSGPAVLRIFATNGFALTNFAGLESGEGTTLRRVTLIVVGCSNSPPAVTFPTLGGSQFGVRIYTNDARPIITLITNAVRVRYEIDAAGTNLTMVNAATF